VSENTYRKPKQPFIAPPTFLPDKPFVVDWLASIVYSTEFRNFEMFDYHKVQALFKQWRAGGISPIHSDNLWFTVISFFFLMKSYNIEL